ncbi:hypothetical protein ES703_107501 [subsurface metagenome]
MTSTLPASIFISEYAKNEIVNAIIQIPFFNLWGSKEAREKVRLLKL